ncbi:MAG: 5-oxopent-3-ene,2,5-tricarboxylate decarboxylase [Glaciihabitans sp.]|nr:5-oxopent-3-ene,2,5-tricarboxylate decarboxylase [Glaciihabitans sp.]
MKIARVDNDGIIEYAAKGDAGWIPLSRHGIHPATSGALVEAFDEIAAVLALSTAADEITPARFLPPITNPVLSVAIGRNYLKHAAERGADVPTAPMMFAKLAGSFAGATDDVVVNTALTSQVDYEVELVVLIGTEASRVSRDTAMDHVAGYLVGNDMSARDCQKSDGQFDRAKAMDGFGPIGPWITTADEVADPQDLDLWLTVNGEERQSSNTNEMIFTVAHIIEYLSQGMTLHPGDVIWTGTPHGVAAGMGSPDAFLTDGDVVHAEIAGLGSLNNTIRSL